MDKSNKFSEQLKATPVASKDRGMVSIIAVDTDRDHVIVAYVPTHTIDDDSWTDDELVDVYIDKAWLDNELPYDRWLASAIEMANEYMQGERRAA